MDIETGSLLSAGQTVCDIWGQTRAPKNCTVCMVSELQVALSAARLQRCASKHHQLNHFSSCRLPQPSHPAAPDP